MTSDPSSQGRAWRDGVPPKPWSSEWFIAETTFGDRVVLRELPDEFTYDFKTADETYIKADKIKRWMQFPDSNLIAPGSTTARDRVEALTAALHSVKRYAASKCPCENELPNPCPLCGASVENLDVCKAVDRTFPPNLLREIEAVLGAAEQRGGSRG